MKQTAVEWIVNKLSITFQTMYSEEIEQAKKMEEEQIEYSYYEGWTESDDYYRDRESILKIAEQYYKETYKK